MAATPTQEANGVVVIIGAGGMGTAIAERLGRGKLVVLADFSEEVLSLATKKLQALDYKVSPRQVNITDSLALVKLATDSAALGKIDSVVNAAGLSPVQSSAALIYAVDLVGTAVVIDAFEPVLQSGSSMVCIASVAGHMGPLPSPEAELHFATALTKSLLQTPAINVSDDTSAKAYQISKFANIRRVKASARRFAARGVRINSVSPGFIDTPMGEAELAGENGDATRKMIAGAPIQRAGRPEEVAEAVGWLCGRGAAFVTGVDLVVDGGVLAGMAFRGEGP